MNTTSRVLTMTGLGLVAGLAVGAGPAQASGTSAQPVAKKAVTQSTQLQQFRGRDYIVGYYRSLRACEFAGRIGERFGKWENYDCEFVRFGFRRGSWALEVSRGWDWSRPGHSHGPWGGDRGHGPFGDRDNGPRDPRDNNNPRDPRDNNNPRDPRDNNNPRDPRDNNNPRDPRDNNNPRDPRDNQTPPNSTTGDPQNDTPQNGGGPRHPRG